MEICNVKVPNLISGDEYLQATLIYGIAECDFENCDEKSVLNFISITSNKTILLFLKTTAKSIIIKFDVYRLVLKPYYYSRLTQG